MHWIDWTIVAASVLGIGLIGLVSSRLTRGVAGFLAAERSAGRYLLTMASGMSTLGAISIAAQFEKYYQAGFGGIWWGQMLAPVALLMALTGFVVYRYRETRVLTMAQFFEVRYSRRFRVFAGGLAFVAGVLNYGIFPAVTARFIIYFTALPQTFFVGGWEVSTHVAVMLLTLSVALALTLTGGQIAVMVTDFFQGQFVNLALVVVLGVMLAQVTWPRLIDGLLQAPVGQSKINPFDQANIPDFDVWFFLMLAALQVYQFRAWQGSQGYNAASRTPHEARMAGILAEFRGMITVLLVLMLPVCVYAVLHLPEFADQTRVVQETIGQIGSAQIQEQMRVPIALSTLLPVGVMGLFAAVILASAISTDDTYLHSWGSIFIQDVVMPFRSRPFAPRTHLRLLRLSIFGIAVFVFCFSLLFPLNEYIFMYFQITGAIFLGGAGAVILGGLYWKRGTVEGAWAAMISGSVLAVAGILLNNIIWPKVLPSLRQRYPGSGAWRVLPEAFPLNGVEMSFLAAAVAVVMYVLFSLLSGRPAIDMDRLLKRGRYRVEDHGHHPVAAVGGASASGASGAAGPTGAGSVAAARGSAWLWRRLGVGPDFTRGDKAIYALKLGWVGFFFLAFVLGTAVQLVWPIPDGLWVRWWAFQIGATLVMSVLSVVWFLIGGGVDLLALFRTLREARPDPGDDGWVAEEEHMAENPAAALDPSAVGSRSPEVHA